MGEFVRVNSTGAHEIESVWRRLVPSARIEHIDESSAAFDWASIHIPGLTVTGYDLTATLRSSVDLTDHLLAWRIDTRDARLDASGRGLRADSPSLVTDQTVRAFRTGRARVRSFVFERDFAQTMARHITGDDALVLRVHDSKPFTAEAARLWETTHRYLMTSFSGLHSDGADDSIVEAELRRHALVTTLSVFPSTFADAAEQTAQRQAAPATVRRALAFMEAHAHEPITIDDVAAASGISTRGLQYAFRRALDTTPTATLRRLRLEGAHAELAAGRDETVSRVAARWGFPDASRFAKYYRAAYGVYPSHTVRHA